MRRPSSVESADRPPDDGPTDSGDPVDAEGLARFLDLGDSAAFEGIVRRHGPSVLRECRRLLGAGPDADDAFQSTFVVLVRSAGSIRRADALGAWLRGVARRVATKARVRAMLLREREVTGVDVEAVGTGGDDSDVEIKPTLRAEVDRLPEKFRVPIELCYWRGLSNEQAAEALDCPTGTVKWRLARGREMLRGRLVRSGLTLLAMLCFWRRPALGASALHRLGPRREGVRPTAGLSDDLVRRTIAAAIHARGGLGSITALNNSNATKSVDRRLRLRRLLVGATVIGAILAAIPAVRAAWSARASAAVVAPTPILWPTAALPHACSDNSVNTD